MSYYHIILFLLATAIAVSALSPKLKVPYPVMLMLAGICVGFIPGITYIPVDPDIVFLVFLPPLLYDAAIDISFPDFKKNIGTISMLAVTMVFVTMCAIAVTAKYFVPGMSWPLAFVLGAILSPPDAVAAAAIIRNMGLPQRTKVILEGESLVNDASALTAYRIAVGVVTGGAFVLWEAGLEFVGVIIGGALIGWVMAKVFTWVIAKVPFTSTATVTLNILLPFVAYQLAESAGVSGVLAVVVTGLMIARKICRDRIFSDMTAVQSKSVWQVLIYSLNGLIFILIGIEVPHVLKDIHPVNIWQLVLSSVLIFIVALAVRILVIFSRKYRLDLQSSLRQRTGHETEHGKGRRKDMMSLDWKNSLVVGWSGMRGIVSVATAIALPVTMSDGEAFPGRGDIIFITVVVVNLMLLVQGLGLPLLIKLLGIKSELKKMDM